MTATVGYATLRQRKQLHLFFDVSVLATVGTSGLGYPLLLRQDSRSYP